MPVDIETMRSEVSIEPATTQAPSASAPAAVDVEQLREIVRELVMDIVREDVDSLFRLRGL